MPGKKAESPLSQQRPAAPCQQVWDTLDGNDNVRFCATCYKNVYKFSNLNRAQAIQLVTAHEGRACAAYYRRADGSIMAEECPVGLRRVQRPVKYVRAGLAVVLAPILSFASLIGISKLAGVPTQQGNGMVASLRTLQPFAVIAECLDPSSECDFTPSDPGYYPAPAVAPAVTYSYYTRPIPEKVNTITPGYRLAISKPAPIVVLPAAPTNAGVPMPQSMGHVAP